MQKSLIYVITRTIDESIRISFGYLMNYIDPLDNGEKIFLNLNYTHVVLKQQII